MIKGIGVDLVQVNRIQRLLDKLADKFARRILTPQEFKAYQQKQQPAHFLAKRFAAKEAVAKALATGIAQGISWQDIRVMNDVAGKPSVVLNGRAAEIAAQQQISAWHLSLSDEKDHVIAFVIAETQQ